MMIPCDNCGSPHWTPQFTHKAYSIVACRRCGLLFVNPQPTLEEITDHYRVDTFWGGEEWQEIEELSPLLYRQVLKFLPPGGEVLDVGCSFGVFLEQLRRRGYSPTGIELSASAAAAARQRGFVVHEKPLGPFLESGQFSAVTLLNVIEHLNAPLAACKEVLRILKPGGVVAIVTPNTSLPLPLIRLYLALTGSHDISARFPRMISQLHPPNHLYFYTRASLTALLLTAGFRSVSIRNAAPIINRNVVRTTAKIGLYLFAETARTVTRGKRVWGHSLLACAFKGGR